MKRIIAFILIWTHLFSTVGFSMEVHECGGEKEYSLYGVHFGSICAYDHEDEEHSDNCCKDKRTVVKSKKQDSQTTKSFVANCVFVADLPQAIALNPCKKDIENAPEFYYNVERPLNHYPPLYILYGVYRI